MAQSTKSVNAKPPEPLIKHKRWALFTRADGNLKAFAPTKQGAFFFDVEEELLGYSEATKYLMTYTSAVRNVKKANADGIAYFVGKMSLGDNDYDWRSQLTAVITHSLDDTNTVAELIEHETHEPPFAVENLDGDGYTFFIHADKFGSSGSYFTVLELVDGMLHVQADKECFIAFSKRYRKGYVPTTVNMQKGITQCLFERYDPSILTTILRSLENDGSLDAFNYATCIDNQSGDIVEDVEFRFGEAINITKEVNALSAVERKLLPQKSMSVDAPSNNVVSTNDNAADKGNAITFDVDKIPAFMHNEPYCFWKLEVKDGRNVKLPLVLQNGKLINADVSNPDMFFDDLYSAVDALDTVANKVTGLGILLSTKRLNHGGVVCVDLDNCLVDGKPNADAAEILDRLDGAYVEVSQSGKGLHFFFVDEYADNITRCRSKRLELYVDKRFIALTGNTFKPAGKFVKPGVAVELCKDFIIDGSVLEYAADSPRGVKPDIDTDVLLSIIRKSQCATTFDKLFDGDTSGVDDDHSRADFALCYQLCFWTNGNFDQILDIWSRSKLADRDKFDRNDYTVRTINNAIALWNANGNKHYEPRGRKPPISTVCVDEPAADSSFDVDELRKLITVNRNGLPVARAHNFDLIFDRDPNVRHLVAFNAFSQRIELARRPFWRNAMQSTNAWQDTDDAALQNYIDRTYALLGETVYRRIIDEHAHKQSFHPVRDFFNALPPWDGKDRVTTLLIDHLGAPDSEYVKAVTQTWLLAAVARVFNPGCRFDRCLVLKGKQGIGKSTLLSMLGGAWFGELDSIQGKDAVERLQGLWIVELVEMQATKKADNEQIKAFLSTQCDRVRLAYGHRSSVFPRQCVFAATTNEHEVLRDQTGGRRFWIVELAATDYAIKPELDVEQVWAQTFHLYKEIFADAFDSAKLDLPSNLKAVAEQLQRDNTEGSDLRGRIAAFLDRPIPIGEFWQLLTIEERRTYFRLGTVRLPIARIEHEHPKCAVLDALRKIAGNGSDEPALYLSPDTDNDDLRYLVFNKHGGRQSVAPVEILHELCYDDRPPTNTRRIADIMRTLDGWQEKRGHCNKATKKAYGRQMTVFVRVATADNDTETPDNNDDETSARS